MDPIELRLAPLSTPLHGLGLPRRGVPCLERLRAGGHNARVSDPQRDVELVRAARAGRPDALEAMAKRLEVLPACVRAQNARFGRRLTREEEEDVVQNVAVSLWRKLDDFDGRASLEAWAWGFVCMEVLRTYERRARRRIAPDGEEKLGAIAVPERESSADDERVRAALDGISEESSQIVRLKHFEDLTFEEIAARRSEPINTVKTRYYRALERLKHVLLPSREARS